MGPADPLKILVHSTHDTAIAALCQTLDVYDEKWPAFTASLTFELFKQVGPVLGADGRTIKEERPNVLDRLTGKKSTPNHCTLSDTLTIVLQLIQVSTGLDIRLRYQNKSLPLPLCAAEEDHLPDHPEFCTLKAFRKRVEELTPKDWDKECAV